MVDAVDASAPGTLSIGGNLRIFSLGNGVFIVVCAKEIGDQMKGIYGDDLNSEMLKTLNARQVLWIHADDGTLGSFTPLEQSDDLKALIKAEITEYFKNDG